MTTPGMISLILPCRNQADHIGQVLARYLETLESLETSFELVVVPNASTDGTREVVEGLARHDPRVRSVDNPEGGWGRSVLMGLDAALGTVLAYTNTARTDPAIVPLFLKRFRDGGNCLVKARREARRAPLRSLGSTLYNLEARVCFGLRCGDVNGTPKVFSRDLYQEARPKESGDLLDLELMARAHRLGVAIVEVPVQGFRRHGGRSSTTLKSAWKMYGGALRLWYEGAARAPKQGDPREHAVVAGGEDHA
jgi:glycosyltransferase involved in cell wall biosynthesis